MDSVVQWATSVSICSVIVCIIEMLISDTAVEKTVRFVLGVFMLCSIIVPLGSIIGDLSADFGSADIISTDIPETLAVQREKLLNQEIRELAQKTLKDEGIEPIEININMDIDENNCISIITAEVILDRSDVQNSARIRDIFSDKLGIECRTVILE